MDELQKENNRLERDNRVLRDALSRLIDACLNVPDFYVGVKGNGPMARRVKTFVKRVEKAKLVVGK